MFVSHCEYLKGEECYQKALAIAKQIGDKRGETACYGNLGNVFMFQAEYAKAKEYHTKALSPSNEARDVEEEF